MFKFPQNGAIPQPNPSYPMAGLKSSAYAPPLSFNQPTEVVGGYDAKINPMTGEEMPVTNFAHGGHVAPQAGIASLLASRGRGGDSTLVHMTPNEVQNLRHLAAATGNEMTVNPHTGLYEASWLDKLLPTIIGAGLSFVPGVGPLGAALMTGAGYAAANKGDLNAGLMAGLGAYGGAGLGQSLAAAGSKALATAGTEAAKSGADAGLKSYLFKPELSSPYATELSKNIATQPLIKAPTLASSAATSFPRAASSFTNALPGITSQTGAAIPEAAATATQAAADPTLAESMRAGLGNVRAGIGSIKSFNDLTGVFQPLNMAQKIGLANTAIAAATPEQEKEKKKQTMYYVGGGYDPVSGFQQGSYTTSYPYGLAEGGSVKHFAAGGQNDSYDPFDYFNGSNTSTGSSDSSTAGSVKYYNSSFGPIMRIIGADGIPSFYGPDRKPLPSTRGRGFDAATLPDGSVLRFYPADGSPYADSGITEINLSQYNDLLSKQTTGGDTTTTTGGNTSTTTGGNTSTTTGGNTSTTTGGNTTTTTGGNTSTTTGGNTSTTTGGGPPGSVKVTGPTTYTGTPLNRAVNYLSAFDPTYSASNYTYMGDPREQLGWYMKALRQSLIPNPISVYDTAKGATGTSVYGTPAPAPAPAPAPSGPPDKPSTDNNIDRKTALGVTGAGGVTDGYTGPTSVSSNTGIASPTGGAGTTTTTGGAGATTTTGGAGATSTGTSKYAANIPLIEKYALELGVKPEEIINIANLTQQGGNLNAFLGGGGENAMYDPSQGSYIKTLIDRMSNTAKQISTMPGGTSGGAFPSMFGYDASGKFVGDLSGGRAAGDITHFDPATKQTVASVYGYDPSTKTFGYVDPATGKPVSGVSYTGPTVAAGSYTSPTWKGASGGLAGLRDEYAAGGKLLRGPGDGMSDSIPAVIRGEQTQRAALADGEFVIPADVVSHLGNGSTDAGSRKLYAMMNKVRKARTGNPNQGKQIDPDKYMPA